MAGAHEKTDDQWQGELTPTQYQVMRCHGTEMAGTSPLNKEKRPGMYRCAACGTPLFSSETKFDSGTGWPSFDAPLEDGVETSVDRQPLHGAHRGALQELRRPSWAMCFRMAPPRPASATA